MITGRQLKIAAKLAAQSIVPLDRLPYTPEFERLHAEFVREAGHACSHHDVWWWLLHARKRGLVGSQRRQARPSRTK